jgi:hypothetical protein
VEERYRPWVDAGYSGLTVNTSQDEAVQYMAEIAGLNG